MKKIVLYFLLLSAPFAVHAQFDKLKDSVVQFYGIVMTSDSLRGIPAVSIMVKGQNRGTISNDQGVFSIVVMKGDKLEFSSIGYKPELIDIPRNLEGNQYSMIKLMVTDAQYLPVTIIKPRPTREQFERDFVNTKVADDDIEIARQNTDALKRKLLSRSLPADATEAANYYLKQSAKSYYYQGQAPPQNIFNPLAWADFIQAWKRGDFKNNN
ncbi:MAG TPA: carboxypeptidase-like regulatory domain-containing protein [Puia sp.]|nr:carboxypeptidase-like regulatory domain-containing protein [Puia sp.]